MDSPELRNYNNKLINESPNYSSFINQALFVNVKSMIINQVNKFDFIYVQCCKN